MMIEICNISVFAVEAIASVYYFENKFQKKCSNKVILIFAGIISLFLYVIQNLNIPLLNAASYMILFFVFLHCCYYADNKSCIFSILLLTAFMIVTETLVMYVSSLIFGIAIDLCLESDFIFAIQAAIAKLLYFLCIYAISKRSLREHKSKNTGTIALLSILPVSSVLFMHTTIYICIYNNLDNHFKMLLIICNILILLSNIAVFYIHELTLKTNQKYTELLLSHQKEQNRMEYYRLLEEQNNNAKILMHDITKHLNAIMLLSSDSHVKSDTYMEEIVHDFHIFHPLDYCSCSLLNLIIYRYSEICQSENIRFCVNVQNTKIDFMSEPDITALFDNLLENAVEASKQTNEKFIDFSIDIRNTNFLVVRMKNSCRMKPVIAGQTMVTSKNAPGLHGIGIKSIRRVVNKYDGNMDMNYNDTEKTFTMTITFQLSIP